MCLMASRVLNKPSKSETFWSLLNCIIVKVTKRNSSNYSSRTLTTNLINPVKETARMKFFSSRSNLLLVLPMLCSAANQECYANPGDLISHNVSHTVTHSTVSTYRVTGWQNSLTGATPNLGNYYWEPMTKRVINTTRTTSKGATAAPTIVNREPQYIKPTHARLPVVNHPQPQPQIAVANSLPLPSTSLSYSTATQPVLSYQGTSLNWSSKRRPETTATATTATKESVYGVLKTPISSMRAKAQSL